MKKLRSSPLCAPPSGALDAWYASYAADSPATSAMFSLSVSCPLTCRSGNGAYALYSATSFADASLKCARSSGVHQFVKRPSASNWLP